MPGGRTIEVLRSLRKQKGFTLQQVASAVGISPGHLSQIERGQVSASIGVLRALAQLYNVPVAFLFEDASDVATYVPRGAHTVLTPSQGGARFELLSPDLNRRIEFLRITLEPGSSTHSTVNVHPGEEVHYVVHGRVEFQVGERTYLAQEGDSIYFLSSVPHRVRNVGETPAVLLTAMSPPTRWAKEMMAAHGAGDAATRRTRRRSVATRSSGSATAT